MKTKFKQVLALPADVAEGMRLLTLLSTTACVDHCAYDAIASSLYDA